jgi:ACR3 family arsenite efflux pump ArsB
MNYRANKIELASNTFHLSLTTPLCIALFGLLEGAACTPIVANFFEVIASELTCKSLLVNESR